MSDFAELVRSPELDLTGGLLVEASAGTGKTYNIQNAYLRLVVVDGLRVQNILVVTFTEAATQELRGRLRQILAACEAHLAAVTAGRGTLRGMDAEAHERIEAILRLPIALPAGQEPTTEQFMRVRRALMDFDSAAIFTIHGFCNRVLDRYAFECGHEPDAELIADTTDLVADVCRDWWRRNTYGDSQLAAPVPFEDFDELARLVKFASRYPDARLQPRVSLEACEQAEAAFAEAIAGALQAMPVADPTNDRSRPVEESLQRDGEKLMGGAACRDLPALWRVARVVSKALRKQDGMPYWASSTPKIKLTLAQRLPGAAETAAAACSARNSRCLTVVDELLGEIRRQIRERCAITYDAMLSRVREALRDPLAGPRLLTVLRGEFHAALVDEFQDTDPVQYETFRRVFADGGLPLLLVGDPKQAIYGFRNGDIFTYYGAKRHIPGGCHTLGTNFRSEVAMVAAINEFFQERDPQDRTFLNDGIAYNAVLANGLQPYRQIRGGTPPVVDQRPFKLWLYDAPQIKGNQDVKDAHAARQIYRDVADEIVRLLEDPGTVIGQRRLRPSDLAILVCNHSEAASSREELLRRGVNAIRQATDNVFTCHEARGVALVMQAMLEPGNARAVRSALASGLLPCTIEELRRFQTLTPAASSSACSPPMDEHASEAPLPRSLEEWVLLIREASVCWHKRSFIEAFRLIADRVGLYAHLARSGSDAPHERLAAVQQLVEHAHQKAVGARLGPAALFRWFVEQMNAETREEDEAFKVRPASDDDAVRIMTVFKSKGLEFPIVFVPTLWRREAKVDRKKTTPFLQYHAESPSGDHTFDLILDLGDDRASEHQGEKLQENIRLAYVALTRAANRVYLLAVDQPKHEDTHAVSRLVRHWQECRQAADAPDSTIEVCERSSSGNPAASPLRRVPPSGDVAPLRPYGERRPSVDKRYGRASYSSLTKGLQERVADTRRDIDDDDAVAAEAQAPAVAAPSGIFLFPGGARTGDCWHTLFEHLDFQADDATRARVIDETLDRFGLCAGPTADVRQQKRDAVHAMVARVLSAQLPGANGGFALRDIPMAARRSELAFDFPLRHRGGSRTIGHLAAILEAHANEPARERNFIAHLSASECKIPLGFMTGSADLIFEHAGRFYLLDWKSNRCENRPERFERDGLAQEMAAHAYYLQYHIYTVAIDGFLRRALAGYDYDRHFGGVFYLFLRGVDGTPGRGIFHDRPSAACIAALSAELMRESHA